MTQFRYEAGEGPGEQIAERSVTEIVAEALRVYRSRWREFLAISAFVHVPVAVVQLLAGTNWGFFVLALALAVIGTAAFYPAAVSGVCQHYLYGRVDAGTAYRRAQWRYVSALGVVALSLAVMVAGAALIWIVVPFVAAVVFTIYWSVAIPAVVVEGHRTTDALRRSYRLIRGNWWRTFGATLLMVAVVLAGYGIQWLVVYAARGSGVATVVDWVVYLAFAVGVAPLLPICFTLLYYDLRARREALTLAILRQEMGMTRPGGPPGSTAARAA